MLWNEEEAAAGEGRKEMKGRIGLERASRAEGRQNDRKADNASVFCMAAKGKKRVAGLGDRSPLEVSLELSSMRSFKITFMWRLSKDISVSLMFARASL